MFKTFLLILAALNIVDAVIRFIKNEEANMCFDLAETSLDIFVIVMIDTLYYHTYYKILNLTSIWFNIALLVIAVPCFIYTFMRSQGWALNVIARDEDGNILTDENGVPLTGKAAREVVKKAKNEPPAMTIKIDGEVNKDASDAATEYMRAHWVEDNKFKTKDDNGNPISEEDILKDVQRYIYKEWAPANGYADEEEEKDPLEELLSKTVLDCVKNLGAQELAEFMWESIKQGCDGCEDFEVCQALSEEERKEKEIQCLVEMLNKKIFTTVTPEEILNEAEDPPEGES